MELLITPFEALRVASGHPVTCKLEDGSAVVVRLPTVDEARTAIESARASIAEDMAYDPNWSLPPMPTLQQLMNMVRPVDV